ncbi:MAG: hypothetical protein AAGA77_19325 [Bacteroidota bacterium]
MKPIRTFAKLFILAGVSLFISCTVKPPSEPKDTYHSTQEKSTYTTTIQAEIEKHGTIPVEVVENGKKVKLEVVRSKIDSLDHNQLARVNEFFMNINSEYPSSKDFVFIKYYPGKDRCNSTGGLSRNQIGERDVRFKAEIQKRERMTAAWIYKNDKGLKKYTKEVQWHPDSLQIIENTFFAYHYPCSSYVILHKSGLYYAFFGESSPDKKIKDIEMFTYHF